MAPLDDYPACRACRLGLPGCTCPPSQEERDADAEWEAARSPERTAEELDEAFRKAREENLQRWGLRPPGVGIEVKGRRVA
jgi:hypothetical protein